MKKIVLIIIMTLGFNIAYSQSIELFVVASSGDYFQGTNATLSWTLGEPAIETYSNDNNILTQGFQQSNYIIEIVNEMSNNSFYINVYPNPSNDFITIQCENSQKDIVIELFDMNGKKLLSQEMPATETQEQLNLHEYAAANYFLRISTKNGELLKTFKIMKVQ